MPPHLVHATVVHPRYDTRILFKQCDSLARSGLGVVSLFVADGRGDETWNGIRIHDVGKPRFGRIGRAATGSFRLWKALRKVKPDLVQIHDPELIPLALLLKGFGTRVLFDMHENLPKEILTKNWVSPPARRIVSSIAREMQLLTSRQIPVIFAEDSYVKDFPSAKKSVVVLNYPLVETLTAIVSAKKTRFTVGYIGGLSAERGALVMLDALARLREKGADVHAVFVGPVLPEKPLAERLAAAVRGGWLTTTGRLEPAEGWSRIAECHVGLAILQPSSNFVDSYPTKLFEYMALGLPVIVSDFPLWREVVETAGCGIMVDPTDVDALATAISWMCDHPDEASKMGRKGREAVLEHYRWDSQFGKLRAFYEDILAAPMEGRNS